MNNEQAAEILQDIFQHAVNSARAGPVTLANLPEKPRGRCVVIGAGKASAAMAAAVDAAWPDVAVSGVVVTRYGYAVPAGRIRIIEAAHPVSDAMSEVAAMLIVETLRGFTADDLVLALTGGGPGRASELISMTIYNESFTNKRAGYGSAGLYER